MFKQEPYNSNITENIEICWPFYIKEEFHPKRPGVLQINMAGKI